MYIAILGRQPALSMVELERVYGSKNVRWFSSTAATINTDIFTLSRLGGTLKAGRVITEFPGGDWRRASLEIVRAYSEAWSSSESKITLGISAYGFNTTSRDVQKTGILIKQSLKKTGTNLRLVPNTAPQLSTATSHHNKLGLSPNKVELLVVRNPSGRVIIAESIGAQNITALAGRDQARPKRDSFVGMLPPKLAQIMINLAGGQGSNEGKSRTPRLLDPFCGTGVILQEAALMGYAVCGTDLSDKMIDYTKANLAWLASSHHLPIDATIYQADAMNARWQPPIDLVVSETYLGQPFSAPPSPNKLEEVKRNTAYITSSFLKNLRPQIAPGTPLCLAVPAWRDAAGRVTHIPLPASWAEFGYEPVRFEHISQDDLLYYREDQIVARELLVLIRT